jgi:thiosulfate/3-mercaptopyruvate sulfurtransferase
MTLPNLIRANDLVELQRRGDVLVVDCRFDLADPGKGEREYLAAHIPSAVYMHLDRDLSDLSKRGLGRHPLPHDLVFSAALARAGWRAGLDVVVYDDAQGALAAARLWWLLRLAGIRNAAVLDGGWAAWRVAGLAVEAGATTVAETQVQLNLDRAQVVWFDEIERRRASGDVLLIDARAAPRYRGEVEPIDPVAGHVPGARNRPFGDNLDASGCFKPRDELRGEFERLLGGRPPREVVHMCGSGVTACHNLLAMEHAGLTGSRVFAPSWSGWISDPSRPVASGG